MGYNEGLQKNFSAQNGDMYRDKFHSQEVRF